jgi:hypothetical protein
MHRLVLNDVPEYPFLSRALWERFRFRIFREHQLPLPSFLRADCEGERPSYVFYDTGADIHEYLSTKKKDTFASVSAESVPWSVTHFSGVTRRNLQDGSSAHAQIVSERLRHVYRLEMNSLQSRTP